MSRRLQALQPRELVARKPSRTARRATELALTAKGRAAFADLDSRSRGVVATLLDRLDAGQRTAVVNAMTTIEHTLDPPAQEPATFLPPPPPPAPLALIPPLPHPPVPPPL